MPQTQNCRGSFHCWRGKIILLDGRGTFAKSPLLFSGTAFQGSFGGLWLWLQFQISVSTSAGPFEVLCLQFAKQLMLFVTDNPRICAVVRWFELVFSASYGTSFQVEAAPDDPVDVGIPTTYSTAVLFGKDEVCFVKCLLLSENKQASSITLCAIDRQFNGQTGSVVKRITERLYAVSFFRVLSFAWRWNGRFQTLLSGSYHLPVCARVTLHVHEVRSLALWLVLHNIAQPRLSGSCI